jgi:hypothetical protein
MMKTTSYAAVVLAAVACKDTSYGLFNHSATACVCTSRFVEMLPSVFRFAMVVYNTVQRCFLRQHDKQPFTTVSYTSIIRGVIKG